MSPNHIKKKRKIMKPAFISVSVLLLFSLVSHSQEQSDAPWIGYPSASVTDYGVYLFRKTVQLEQTPDELRIHVSADNRYHLYVNGKRICYGPAKGDLQTYKYDIIDIAPYLKNGNRGAINWQPWCIMQEKTSQWHCFPYRLLFS